jgi:hypothetical protein
MRAIQLFLDCFLIFKPDMHTPSVIPKRNPLAKRARSTVETRGGGAFYLDGASEPYN